MEVGLMGRHSSPRRRAPGAAVGLALLVALAAGWLVGAVLPREAGSTALAAEGGWPPKIEAVRTDEDGREVGDLRIDGDVVLRLRADSADYSAYERAVVVAERLNLNLVPRRKMTIAAGLREGANVVLVNGTTLVTPLRDDLPRGMSTREAAQMWAERLSSALDIELGEREEAVPFRPAEPYEDRIVPIISFLSGTRIGGARVNGPRTAVKQVQAVVQLEARLLSAFQAEIYVPVSTTRPGKTLDRVQGVAVTAVGDLRI
jgi:hypothetical protein